MKQLHKSMVITELACGLFEHESWCGETHLQKATYFLQKLMGVPTEFEFILYKHGPFSFDLRDHLTEMRAYGLIELVPRPYPYGPSMAPTSTGKELKNRFPKTLAKHQRAIAFVASKLESKGVVQLEKLATALFVSGELGEGASAKARADRVCELKPHLTRDQAILAVVEVDELTAAAADA